MASVAHCRGQAKHVDRDAGILETAYDIADFHGVPPALPSSSPALSAAVAFGFVTFWRAAHL